MAKEDSSNKLVYTPMTGASISIEAIKTIYICEGISAKEIAKRLSLPIQTVDRIIDDQKLEQLRASHIKHGLAELKNVQLVQAEKMIDIESKFKRLRIIQLEKILEDFMAYFGKYGHFNKVHPITGEILIDGNGLPIQLKIPNVTKELTDLKEGFTLSEGVKMMLNQIDDIINKPSKQKEEQLDPNVIDVTEYNGLFQKKTEE